MASPFRPRSISSATTLTYCMGPAKVLLLPTSVNLRDWLSPTRGTFACMQPAAGLLISQALQSI